MTPPNAWRRSSRFATRQRQSPLGWYWSTRGHNLLAIGRSNASFVTTKMNCWDERRRATPGAARAKHSEYRKSFADDPSSARWASARLAWACGKTVRRPRSKYAAFRFPSRYGTLVLAVVLDSRSRNGAIGGSANCTTPPKSAGGRGGFARWAVERANRTRLPFCTVLRRVSARAFAQPVDLDPIVASSSNTLGEEAERAGASLRACRFRCFPVDRAAFKDSLCQW
jgi:hypothetical protein